MKLFIAAAIVSLGIASEAVAQAPPRSGILGREALGVETQAQVDQKLLALNNEIPKNLADLIAENNRVETDLTSANDNFSRVNSQIERSERDARELTQLNSMVAAAKNLNCSNTAGFRGSLKKFMTIHDRIDRLVPDKSPFDIDIHSSCESYKQAMSDTDSGSIDSWALGDRSTSNMESIKKLADSYGKLTTGLRSRQTAISNSLKEIQQRESLTSNFPWFIGLFGGLSLAAIFVVSKFSTPELQMEWVASGQITQFVTVMILMIVITMLGLSKTINGETLGTLLGGVAGYVLAQGVGRAAARDASRNLIK